MNHKLFFNAVVLSALVVPAVATATDYSGLTNQNISNTAIVDNVGAKEYKHTGTISGTSSLTLNGTTSGSSSRQWLNGTYSFTGPIQVNSGQLLLQKKQSTQTVTVGQEGGIGGSLFAMCENALPSGANITVKSGYSLCSEVARNTLYGTTLTIEDGGRWQIGTYHASNETWNQKMTLNIAGDGDGTGAFFATCWISNAKGHASISGTINLTDDATIGNTMNMAASASRQFYIFSNISGAEDTTLTLKGAVKTNQTIINIRGDNSGFKGDFAVDTGKVYFDSATSTGSAKGVTLQNGGVAFLFYSNLLNGKTLTVKSGSFISAEGSGITNGFNGADIYLESDGAIVYWTGTNNTDNVNILSTGDGTVASRYEKGGTGSTTVGGTINVTGPFQLKNKSTGWGNRFAINSKITGNGLLETNAPDKGSYVCLEGNSLTDFTGSIKTMGAGYTNFYGDLGNITSFECNGIAIMDKSSQDQIVNNLTGTGEVWTIQTGGFIANNTVDTTFTGGLNTRRLDSSATDGTITKTGSATLSLNPASGKNLWANFVVSEGCLNINGTTTGSIDVQNLAFVSPGTQTDPIGVLTVQSDFTLKDGGVLKIDVADFETSYDVLNIFGNATFEDGSILSVVLPYSASKLGESFAIDILNATETVTGDVELKSNDYSWLLSFNPATGILSGVADPNYVPEPSTWALLILGFAGLMWCRKREQNNR